MANTGAQFAFVVGEVAPNFYGRSDLAKYPLGLAECENFFVNYKGGLINCPGTEMLMLLPEQHFRFVRFKAPGDDFVLLFLDNVMLVFRDGGLVTSGTASTITDTAGTYTLAGLPASGWLSVSHPQFPGIHRFVETGTDQFTLETVFGDQITGEITVTKVYQFTTGIAGADLAGYSFTQDDATVVCTSASAAPLFIRYVAANSWSITSGLGTLAAGPASLTATPSGSASTASTCYAVSAVIDEVETQLSPLAVCEFMVNITTTTGLVRLSWPAVSGADYYRIYRSLVFPQSPFPTGAEMGYLGKTTGTTFQDMNITPDFTKTPPKDPDYFADGNYPALYSRFQQRGVYSGLAKAPLAVVGSISQKRRLFSTALPVLATDSYSYEIDADSLRPIKHMLPLRYGLMLFTDEAVYQLYGGSETRALTATSAQVDVQTYTAVSDMKPVVVNLDVLFMSALNTEFNAMVYTEYTNSFKTQDIMVLSSHLFNTELAAIECQYAAEPHKLIRFLRSDGQQVNLTYERSQEVFGWARRKTAGAFLGLCVIREGSHNLPYYAVRRRLRGKWVMCIERERPRKTAYKDQWFVDCGAELAPTAGTYTGDLRFDSDVYWTFRPITSGSFPGAVGDHFYAADGIFVVTAVGSVVELRQLSGTVADKTVGASNYLPAWSWHVATPRTTVSGLWWLEGETVSALGDGDAYVGLVVEDGAISLVNEAGRIVVGLPYVSRAKTLPLGLDGYNIAGKPQALRAVSTRLYNSRGLAVGASDGQLEELPAATFTNWGATYDNFSGLYDATLFGGVGWSSSSEIIMSQQYPLAVEVLGLTFSLDIGEN